ncbi:MAG TPA: MFS transporter [Xanthobacteraceae bacterium]|nr:MFS transporter [Xanthobacteraceae bacterium]
MKRLPANQRSRAKRRGPLATAAGYSALCAAIGVQMPFLPLFLTARGLGPEAIGIAIAMPMAIRLVAMPLAGVVSDRSGMPRAVLAALGLASAAVFALVGLVAGTAAILVAVGLSAFVWSPAFPLLESYAVQLAKGRAVDYGRSRLWGSGSFVAANLAVGYLLDFINPGAIIWLIAAPCFLFALTTRFLPPLAHPEHEGGLPAVRPPKVLLLGVVAAALVQASHALFYGFSSLQWSAKGLSPGTIGFLWSLGTIAEMGLFFGGTKLTRKIPALRLIALGGLAATLRFGAFALDPPTVSIALLQLLHAFSFGATHLGLMVLIAEHVPAHQAGRAQTFASAVLGFVMAAGTVAAGPLYVRFGTGAYGWFAVLGAIGGLLALLGRAQPQRAGSGGEISAPL